MILGVYYFLKPDEEALPIKRGDTLQVLWEGDPATWSHPQSEHKYGLILVSKEGDSLEGKSLSELVTEVWTDFVVFHMADNNHTRDQTLLMLAEHGLIAPEVPGAIRGKPMLECLGILDALSKGTYQPTPAEPGPA